MGKLGFTPEQKITSVLRILAYGSSANKNDEYIRMGESTSLHYLEHFCKEVIEMYRLCYLQQLAAEDLKFILSLHSSKGFPGPLESLDVTHWKLKNCPTAWPGQYKSSEFFLFSLLLFYTNITFKLCFIFYFSEKERKKSLPLPWKPWWMPSCGFGMPSLVHRVLRMTLSSLIEARYWSI